MSRTLLTAIALVLLAAAGACARPVAYWSFDEGEGSIAGDRSGHLNHASLHGPTWTEGKVGGGLSFDGAESDQYLVVPSSESLQLDGPFTMQLWWLKTTNDVQIFFRKGRGLEDKNYYGYLEGGLRLNVGCADGNAYTAKAPAPEDGWHHLAFSYDLAHLRVIVDGEVKCVGKIPSKDDVKTWLEKK